MEALKRMLCKHNWIKIGFHEKEDEKSRYSMRHYECEKCRKRKWVDSRKDKLGNQTRTYYYILRDFAWWQQVSELIYNTWTQPKLVSNRKLTDEELEEELYKIWDME